VSYSAVASLIERLRVRTGIELTAHTFRHTFATELLRKGTPVEIVRELLGHASVATTVGTYAHLTVEDSRRALVAVGLLPAEDTGQ
jgi:integrase/recombinase XerD